MASALVILAAAGTVAAQDRDMRLAFVRLDRVFSEYYKTRLADTRLKAQAEEFNKERQGLIAEFQKLQTEYNALREEALNTALSEEVRAQKRSLAEEKLLGVREQEARIKRFDELRSKQIEDQTRRMRRNIVEEIREAVREYARAQGFDAVLDASGQTLNGVESVVFFSEKLDITAAVIEAINKGAEAETPTP
jgi:outer membrane protein